MKNKPHIFFKHGWWWCKWDGYVRSGINARDAYMALDEVHQLMRKIR